MKTSCRTCRHVAYKQISRPVVKWVVLACSLKRVQFVHDAAGLAAVRKNYSEFNWEIEPKECVNYEKK